MYKIREYCQISVSIKFNREYVIFQKGIANGNIVKVSSPYIISCDGLINIQYIHRHLGCDLAMISLPSH